MAGKSTEQDPDYWSEAKVIRQKIPRRMGRRKASQSRDEKGVAECMTINLKCNSCSKLMQTPRSSITFPTRSAQLASWY